jgi:Flp pilus assembly protein CpaB
MRTLVFIVALVFLAGFAGVSQKDYLSAKRKFQAIDKQPPKPGTRVTITSAELNAYVQAELLPASVIPGSRGKTTTRPQAAQSLISLSCVPHRENRPVG